MFKWVGDTEQEMESNLARATAGPATVAGNGLHRRLRGAITIGASLLLLLRLSLCSTTPPSDNNNNNNRESVLDCYVLEEIQPNTQVSCNIVRDHGLDRKYNSSIIAQLRFGFLTLLAPDKQFFLIEEEGGAIRVTRTLDRDELCPRTKECFVKFDVAVRPIQFFMIVKVRVNILDINDNPPFFPRSSVSYELSEASDTGLSFFVPVADDLDSPRNGVSHYNILPPTNTFELSRGSRPDGSPHLRLVLRERVDRELKDFYQFNVIALDGGEPAQTALLLVNVTVLDANDNSPEFENVSYEVRLREDATVGSIVFRVRARDPDFGANGQIVYNFTAATIAEFGESFEIRSDTGNVYTRERLDYESKPLYVLYVTATDRGLEERMSSQILLMVRIVDVNDNQPHIRINSLQPHSTHQHPEVLEGSEIGSFVAHISVEDKDSGTNGKFHCFIADSKLFELRQMYPTEFKVVTLVKFDREARDQHGFTITCRDSGVPALTSTLPVRVTVRDRNDHAPVFLRDYYHAVVEENGSPGATVAKVTAVDRDSGLNGQIVYSLDPESSKMAAVDPTSGLITTKMALDHENASSHELEVFARDLGEPPRSASVRVYLIVRDVDDETPAFLQGSYTFSVRENEPSGTPVGTVSAMDRDAEPFNRVVYSLEPTTSRGGDDQARTFRVDSTTGHITLLESLDREERSAYNLTVSAGSADFGPRDTAYVIVYVDDVNDNKPTFEYPTERNDSVHVSCDVPLGHAFAKVTAHDLDSGINARLTYSLRHKDSHENIFYVDPDTGMIGANVRLRTLNAVEIPIEVTAVDGGEPPLSDTAQLVIRVRYDLPQPRQEEQPNRFQFTNVHTASHRDQAHSPSSSSSSSSSDQIYTLLASEDLAVVLLITLVTIVVAIAIIIAIICLARQRRRWKKYDGKLRRSNSDDTIDRFVPGKGIRVPLEDLHNPGGACAGSGKAAAVVDNSSSEISSSNQLTVSFPKESSNVVVSSGKKSSPNSDASTSDSGRGQSSEDAGPATAAADGGSRPPTAAPPPTVTGGSTIVGAAAAGESYGQPKTRLSIAQGPDKAGSFVYGSGSGGGLVLQEKDARLMTAQSFQPTQQEVRVLAPFEQISSAAAAADTVAVGRLPDISHHHLPSSSSRLLQISPPTRRSNLHSNLISSHCSHLDAMRSSTPRDLHENSRAYSTLAPCYGRGDHQTSFYASLSDPHRESVAWALDEPTAGGGGHVGGRYFSLNRLRQEPLYAHTLSISAQSSAAPSSVDGGCPAAASSRFDVSGLDGGAGHESRRRRCHGYQSAAPIDTLRPCSPKLAGIYRTTTKGQPNPSGTDQGFDCY